MNIQITKTIFGQGSKVYTVNFVDPDDDYNVDTEVWAANNPDHLKEQVKAHTMERLEWMDEDDFETRWEDLMYITEIGNVI